MKRKFSSIALLILFCVSCATMQGAGNPMETIYLDALRVYESAGNAYLLHVEELNPQQKEEAKKTLLNANEVLQVWKAQRALGELSSENVNEVIKMKNSLIDMTAKYFGVEVK